MVAKKQHADKKRFSLPTFIPSLILESCRLPLQIYKSGLWNNIDANAPRRSLVLMDAQHQTLSASFGTSSRSTFNSLLPRVLVQ